MKIEFEGRTWDFDTDDIDVRQATVLYLAYQLTIMQYNDGFDVLDQRVYHFAYWLMLQQNGVVRTLAECNPKIVDFMAAVTGARVAVAKAEAEAEAARKAAAEADPTNEPPSGPQGEPTASKASATPKATTRQRRDQPQEEEASTA